MSDNSETEDNWITSQRKQVEEYLLSQNVAHLGVGDWPAFHTHPYVALWAVQSKKSPGQIGWWVISGDLPTDYISRNDGKSPQEALRAFSSQWLQCSENMLHGEKTSGISVGTSEQWPVLGDLLKRRAELIRTLADDETIWQDEEPEPGA